MTPPLVDANVLLRFLVADVPVQAEAANRLLDDVAGGSLRLRLTTLTFAEIVWVLEKVYRWPRRDITARLAPLLVMDGLDSDEPALLREAMRFYGSLNIDFIDAYHGAAALASADPTIYSFDHDLDRVAGVIRKEP